MAEFQQVKGVIADYNLTLGDLIGVLHMFFKRLGMNKIKFKPAYNPYTEPGMEIFCYYQELKNRLKLVTLECLVLKCYYQWAYQKK